MHELAIAESIVRIALAHAGDRRVVCVDVKCGHLRQVVPDALAFAFALVTEGTQAEGAELKLEPVPAAGRCRRCGADGELPAFPLTCGTCGSWDVEVLRGEELLVESLECEAREVALHGD